MSSRYRRTHRPASGAVTIFLRWSDIQHDGANFTTLAMTRVENEISEVIAAGKQIILVPFFQSSGPSAGHAREAGGARLSRAPRAAPSPTRRAAARASVPRRLPTSTPSTPAEAARR